MNAVLRPFGGGAFEIAGHSLWAAATGCGLGSGSFQQRRDVGAAGAGRAMHDNAAILHQRTKQMFQRNAVARDEVYL